MVTMPEEFYRIKRLPPYVFAQIKQLVEDGRSSGRDIVDFGFGNPDLPSPPVAVEKLAQASRVAKKHR